MHHGDFLRDVRQIQRFLDGRVAAADYGHILIAEEKSVAGRTRRHALAFELFFGRNAKIFRRRARSDDERVAGVFATVADEAERALRQIRGVNVIENDIGVETLRVFLHAFHQSWTLQTFDIAGPVVDFRRRHQLTALLQPGDERGLEIRARRITAAV